MPNQETQTQDTIIPILPPCNHEKEINDQVIKRLKSRMSSCLNIIMSYLIILCRI